jgi:hypothetical protein
MNQIDIPEAEEVSIRTALKAGDQYFGSGGATGGNTGGDSDPGRNGLIGSGT